MPGNVKAMRIQISILAASLVGTGVALGVALQLERKATGQRVALVSAVEKRSRLEAAIARTRASRAGIALDATALEAATRVAEKSFIPPAAQSIREVLPLPVDPLLNDPVLQNLYLAAERANIGVRYEPLFKQLNIEGAQIESFIELAMKRHEQRMDLADIQQSQGLGAADPALAALRRKAAEDFEKRQVALLGRGGYQRLQEFERKLPVLELVNHFAGAVALEGQPLTPLQSDNLATVLANASAPYNDGGPADPDRVDWPVALSESAKVLSEPQQRMFFNLAPRYPVDDGGPHPTE